MGSAPECGGELRQLAFVLVHDCGNMMSINPQPCSDPNHGYDHIYLNKQNINDPLVVLLLWRVWRLLWEYVEAMYEV